MVRHADALPARSITRTCSRLAVVRKVTVCDAARGLPSALPATLDTFTFAAGLFAALRTSIVPMPEIVSLPRNDNRTPPDAFAFAPIRDTCTALPVGAAAAAVAVASSR